MTMTQADITAVDPLAAYEAHAVVRDNNPVKAVQDAYNRAVNAAVAHKRLPIMVSVVIRVAPQE